MIAYDKPDTAHGHGEVIIQEFNSNILKISDKKKEKKNNKEFITKLPGHFYFPELFLFLAHSLKNGKHTALQV